KYLDQWPRLFPSLKVLRHEGVNVGPWNVATRRFRFDRGLVQIDGQPLVCFHFQGLKHVVGPLYESGLRPYRVKLDRVLRAQVFEPYLAHLAQHEAALARAGLTSGHAKSQRSVQSGVGKLWQRATKAITVARLLMSGTYLLMPRAGYSSP
ncbi:MAG: uncharacterized protein JWM53_2639, partial [bacterium]|nr:uncharacterized protein [bacterium]